MDLYVFSSLLLVWFFQWVCCSILNGLLMFCIQIRFIIPNCKNVERTVVSKNKTITASISQLFLNKQQMKSDCF